MRSSDAFVKFIMRHTLWAMLGVLPFVIVITTITAWNDFQKSLSGRLLLAPLTRGGNLAFRRLCADFGCTHTMSEMAIARNLFRGYHKNVRKERALCRKSELDKSIFGFQIATKSSDEAIKAAEFAKENGASWIDLNCGCPIWEAESKGLGCAMLKRPEKLYKMVEKFSKESQLPVTVKIRLGVTEGTGIIVDQVVQGLKDAGAQAITIHGRTGEARYSKPANWPLITEMAKEHSPDLPIIGNGDILTHWECNERLEKNGVHAIMAARGH